MQFWSQEIEKQVGDRVQTILQDEQLFSVFQQFGPAVFRRSSVFHGLAKFMGEQDVRGDVCFEVGTWNGLTAIVLSRFFKRVVTVDIAHNDIKREIIAHLGIDNIECIDIRDNTQKADIAARTQFDCAYLDGDHAHDTEGDWEITKKGERVIFHEVWPFQRPVHDLVYSLPPEQVTFGGMGLALWDGRK